jgi:hypothetical protein
VIQVLEAAAGVLIIVATLADVFQSVVTPRPAGGRFRISRYATRGLWMVCRWGAGRMRNSRRREGLLGSFGPAIVLIYLLVWLILLVLGYGLLVNALAAQVRPRPADLGTSLYIAGTSLFTIGFGDYVGITPAARLLNLAAAGTGLGVLALTVTFLFSLYGAFQHREVAVVTLEAGAGAPPSGVTLLETYARAGIVGELAGLFRRWQESAAEILDSHLAYPVLAYFRSSHDNDSWISSLGAVLDATTLVLTTIDGSEPPFDQGIKGWAKLSRAVLGHCVEDIVISFGLPDRRDVGVELADYQEARERLAQAGYQLRPEAAGWEAFSAARAEYAGRVNALARYWASPPALWIGDDGVLRRTGHERQPAPGRQSRATPR